MNLRFFLFSFLVFSCSSIQPRPENAIGVVKSVYDKDEEKRGDLFLQEDGLWAYVGEKISSDAPQGTLLFYGASDNSHSFAVVETTAWGLILQRLDSEPLEANQNEDFIVSDMSLKDQQSWSFCTTDACLKEYRPGVVFHLYAQDNAGRLIPSDIEDLRFPRTGIARISSGEIVVDGVKSDKFIAVASSSRDYPTKGRIANDGCSIVNKDTTAILDDTFPKEQTPVDISFAAVEKSVDGFIRCRDGDTLVAIPALWRAHHPMLFGTFSIAPIISSQVYEIPTPSPVGLNHLTKFMTAVATGDFAAADFWLDMFTDEHPEKAFRDFIKNAAEISTAANRPENAIRLLKRATTGSWNPENDARWNVVRYRVDKLVGTPRNAILRYSKLPEIFEREEDTILDFLTFFSLREERSQNREIGKPEFIGEKEKWRRAIEVDRNLEYVGEEKPETITPDVVAALALFEKDTKNPHDIFARGPLETQSTATILQRGKSQMIANHSLSSFRPSNNNDVFSKQVYLFESLSSDDKKELLSRLIATGLDKKACEAAQKSDIYSQMELRLATDDTENDLLLWYVDAGIMSKCEGDIPFIASAKEASQDLSLIGPSILLGVLSREKIEQATAIQISEFAINNARGPSCEMFHTGFAFSLFKRDNFSGGLEQLANASKCVDTKSEDLTTLLTFAFFERTGEINGSPETQKKIKQAVRATENSCPGNLPLNYQIDKLVSSPTQIFAKKFSFGKATAKGIQFEKTGNAVNDGKTAIRAVQKSLSDGNFQAANLALQDAQKAFEMARFYPGLHRVRFLKNQLTQVSKKKGEQVKPTKIATLLMEKKTLEESNRNTILMKTLKNESLGNLQHPDLCSTLIIPQKKIVIENPE